MMGDEIKPATAHVIEDCDVVSSGNQAVNEVRADEAGATGHENVHRSRDRGVVLQCHVQKNG